MSLAYQRQLSLDPGPRYINTEQLNEFWIENFNCREIPISSGLEHGRRLPEVYEFDNFPAVTLNAENA